jgi:uncharacterized membrane protein YccF (DUF307 family)
VLLKSAVLEYQLLSPHIRVVKGATVMPLILFILNVLWFITGGVLAGLAWVLAGVIMAITIVGLPWARSCFMLARFSFWPFGYDIVARDALYGREDLGTGALGTLGNVIWFGLDAHWRCCCLCRHHHRHSFCVATCKAGRGLFVPRRQNGCYN